MKKALSSAPVHYLKTLQIERLSPLSKSWGAAAGMAKRKRVALEKHAKAIRNEWSSK